MTLPKFPLEREGVAFWLLQNDICEPTPTAVVRWGLHDEKRAYYRRADAVLALVREACRRIYEEGRRDGANDESMGSDADWIYAVQEVLAPEVDK